MFTPEQYCEKAVGYRKLVETANGPNERREFQELEQSFTVLADADNEQWLADNHDKTARGTEPDESDGAARAKEEEHILRCLGAAVILLWNTLPKKLRRELFDNAGSMGELLETGELRGKIARFLHKHKNDKGATATPKSDLNPHAAAIERWDNEGGASFQALQQERLRRFENADALLSANRDEQEDS
jgi:hypothetical protein